MLRWLRRGRADIVLVIDYPGARAEATFQDFVRVLPDQINEIGVVEALPPQDSGWALEPRDYVGEWVGDIQADPLEVRSILGYCAGGLLACCLADALADLGRPVDHVIVFDTTEVDRAELEAIVRQSFDGLKWAMPESDRGAVDAALDACAGRPVQTLLDTAWRTYVEASRALLGRELSEPSLTSLHRQYSQWLAYLAAASACRLRTRSSSVTAVTSIQYATVRRPGRQVTVDVDHAALLRAPETATVVAGILAG